VSGEQLLDLWRSALSVLVSVAAPFLITCLAVGLVVAVVQTATQLQESVLTFVPKLAAALIVVALGGRWIVDQLGRFTTESITSSWHRNADPGTIDTDLPDPPTQRAAAP
jgi:flagellar biosynthetic protein FliQ